MHQNFSRVTAIWKQSANSGDLLSVDTGHGVSNRIPDPDLRHKIVQEVKKGKGQQFLIKNRHKIDLDLDPFFPKSGSGSGVG